MNHLLQIVSTKTDAACAIDIQEAQNCLLRFTKAFNACDANSMDAELHFPHTLCAGSCNISWEQPGRHPDNFFTELKAMGWASTRYNRITPVLAQSDKVHFVVHYSRLRNSGESLSEHENLWIVGNREGKWGILVRSY